MPLENIISHVFRQFIIATLATMFQMSSTKRWALTVYGADNPAGSNTDETKLGSLSFCLIERTIHASGNNQCFFTWSHLRPKTCDDCSEPLQISLMGEDVVSQSSGFLA